MAKSIRRTTTKIRAQASEGPAAHAPRPMVNPTIDQIAARAFALYCERGRQHGRDVEDWLQAERELLQEPPRSNAA